MKKQLSFSDIKDITCGAVRFEEKDGRLFFYRFTEDQMAAYKAYSEEFFIKCHATAGVRLAFATDSTSLELCAEYVERTSSRDFFALDLYVDGALVKSYRGKPADDPFDFSLTAEFGEGKKEIAIYLPWSVQISLLSLSIDEGASLTPIKRPYKMIAFGDSITHGYDAQNPSFSYASRLADALCADAVNKGIGGEVFFPTLAELRDDLEPDIITVAYGTNDWAWNNNERFEKNSVLFYERLSKNYPNARIFALAPIWREACTQVQSHTGEFRSIAMRIKNIVSELPNVTFIDCFDFVPHEQSNFVSDILHPNDKGSGHYAYNLYAEIKKYL